MCQHTNTMYFLSYSRSQPLTLKQTNSFRDAFGDAIQFVKQASATCGEHYLERCQVQCKVFDKIFEASNGRFSYVYVV
jgi:hypothetical protein